MGNYLDSRGMSNVAIKDAALFTLVFLLAIVGTLTHQKKYDLKLIHQWKQIEYKFHSEAERSEAISNGTFNVEKVIPIDAQYEYNADIDRERIFVTTPRQDPTGIPATLGVITDETRDGNPIIDPYPAWSWQINPENCRNERITSVFRVWVDECGRLWVVDSGIVGNGFPCPPQILAFDLKTDTLLHRYELPYAQYEDISLYITPVVEVESRKNKCVKTWLYIADTDTPSILVYSLEQNTSWRIQDRSFDVNPIYANLTIGGVSVVIADGVFTVALSPVSDGPDNRKLRYHALSSVKESWVYLKHLKKQSNFKVPYGSPNLFYTYKHTRDQQSATEATDREGNVYFSLLEDTQLAKWDPNTPYKQENFEIIAEDKEGLQYPSGLKVLTTRGGQGETLWVFSNAYQRYAAGKLNASVVNFRLFVAEL